MPGIELSDYLQAAEQSRPDEIRDIIDSVERYNPEKIPALEGYLDSQLRNDTYDRDANLALLKLYQFNPDLLNPDVAAAALVKALTALPDPDFGLCCCLLTDEVCAQTALVILTKMQQMLETASFKEFWAFLKENEEARRIVDICSNFDDRVRDFIARTLAAAYQSVSIKLVGEWLELDDEGARDYVAGLGWSMDESDRDVACPPLTSDNDIKAAVVTESIRFESLTKLLAASNSSVW
ncbi:armadillo-type protein [Hyaloraphidium curvatum]|nr:armadillo-type protein [Hyaloraphidium curvatum]